MISTRSKWNREVCCEKKSPIFGAMQPTNLSGILVKNTVLQSDWLEREVKVDFYLPPSQIAASIPGLLLINDGQNMAELGLETILENLYADNRIEPLVCVAIHAGEERKMEYGVAAQSDYQGRGARASAYTSFVFEELFPHIIKQTQIRNFKDKGFAGFSLGGLSALDIVWEYPAEFTRAGVFSGSLWWRSINQDDKAYDDHQHRIMHQQVRKGIYHPGMKFFLQCGNKDETNDRNNNGIIDSIDDTIDLAKELMNKGYELDKDIFYLEIPGGGHDIPTWSKAMPTFLEWGWRRS